MKFALDTYREIVSGTPARQRRAIATFALWFVAGAYVTSTLLAAISPFEGVAVELLGGTVVAMGVAAIKLT